MERFALASHQRAFAAISCGHFDKEIVAVDGFATDETPRETTLEKMAGLPVLTCTGDTFPSRVGASLLSAVGLPELITHSLAEYEALALRLAREPALIDGLRQRLAASRAQAPLFDMPRLARHIESAYEAMVARAHTGQLPTPLLIGVAGTVG
jgi:acetyl-CoA acetyltransferase